VFPRYEPSPADPFLRRLQASGRKWVVITDAADEPRLVLDSDSFLRAALFSRTVVSPAAYWECDVFLVAGSPGASVLTV
jgi:hypothetical protein